MLPVPLNSSKITSSMREPVSMSAVAMIVSEPPSVDVARRAEEALGLLEAFGVDAAAQDLSGLRRHGVVRARETRDRVQQNHDVLAALDEPLGLLDHHVRDGDVARRFFVERRRDHFGVDVGDRVRHFFRPLVDQQNDERDFGMILDDRIGDLLEENRLAGARRRHDQTALAFADRRDEIHDAHADVAVLRLEMQATLRIARTQVVERRCAPSRLPARRR